VNGQKLFVIKAQDFAGLRVHQMRLSARKARHLNVGEVLVFGVISDPSLDAVACVGASVGERGRDVSPSLLSEFFAAAPRAPKSLVSPSRAGAFLQHVCGILQKLALDDLISSWHAAQEALTIRPTHALQLRRAG
jgi:hypothetical protein